MLRRPHELESPLAQHKSAKKRARQGLKRRARNRHVRGGMRTAVKAAHEALAKGDVAATETAVRSAEGTLRRAASKGAIPKKRASRQISRLAKRRNVAASSASS
jgi:small subunit ribosomal protein S20